MRLIINQRVLLQKECVWEVTIIISRDKKERKKAVHKDINQKLSEKNITVLKVG